MGRVVLVYGGVVFVVWQVAEISFPAPGIPPWGLSLVVVLSALGLPLAVVLVRGSRRQNHPLPPASPAEYRLQRRERSVGGAGLEGPRKPPEPLEAPTASRASRQMPAAPTCPVGVQLTSCERIQDGQRLVPNQRAHESEEHHGSHSHHTSPLRHPLVSEPFAPLRDADRGPGIARSRPASRIPRP